MSTSPVPTDPAGPDRVMDLGRLLLGLVVVSLGVLYLLDAADVLDAGKAISDWWPLLLVAAGLLTMLERPPSVMRGVVLTGAGVVLLLFTTDVLDEDAWEYVWPVAIIIAGLLIMVRWRGHRVPTGAREEDVVRATAVFGGPKIASSSQRFEGAWLTAVFGGITLDLRHAKLDPAGSTVNATAAFGGIDIIVPRGWRITVRSTPILGGVEDKTDHAQVPAEGAPVLRVDAVAAFGGVTVKHEP